MVGTGPLGNAMLHALHTDIASAPLQAMAPGFGNNAPLPVHCASVPMVPVQGMQPVLVPALFTAPTPIP